MTTATKMRELDSTDEMAARRFADTMLAMMRDFIPQAAHRDAWDHLAKLAMEQKFELTDWRMRRMYEAWKSATLDLGVGR